MAWFDIEWEGPLLATNEPWAIIDAKPRSMALLHSVTFGQTDNEH